VIEIDKELQNDEVALLSPAAASLDEFSSYAQRGNEFKEAISKL
jgi:UDP-N-acetylmuramoylalanine--D-glutamate ligase